jgi:hypothetical protein
MTDEPTFSFVYDRAEAARVFTEIGTQALLLAILARVPPEPGWEGCLVYRGEAPEGSARNVCIGMRGPAAMEVQERIVQAFEETGIPVPSIYEGGPEPQLAIARVVGGVWATP